MRSFDDRAAALFHKSQQRCAFHCASHRLPTVVWNFLERRAIGIGLRPGRRLRLLSGVDFVEQLADQAECVDLIIVRAGRETEQLRPQVRGVLFRTLAASCPTRISELCTINTSGFGFR